MSKKLKGLHDYYALICDDSKWTPKNTKANVLICGVFSTRKEAEECAKDVQGCMCKHTIKKCQVVITYLR